ncbi:MAG: hypothetical protein AB8G22_12475 [Saprospiraceae bacterium]
MKKSYFLLLLLFVISSCQDQVDIEQMIEGLTPIYVDPATAKEIKNLPIQPIQQLGKIYYKDPYIFVSEIGKGIHVLDNTDPTDPTKITFIQVIGNQDLAIKNNFLYADNLTDLVVLDISDLMQVKVVNRVADLYDKTADFPANYQGTFECVNPELGVVVGWESAMLDNPRCFR